MSQSFGPIETAKPLEDWEKNNRIYHKPSNQHFVMSRRDGKYFQRRYQLDAEGREINSLEVEINFTIGSGNHERDYLHRSSTGELLQLPVAWYAETGTWGIAPGYDRPDHEGFSRRINYRCVFCHTAYPPVAAGADRSESQVSIFPQQMKSGVDCERCHGPGERHINNPSTANIVNPVKLGRKLEMDVCMQCHLETTSAPLPNMVLKLDRTIFSFRPGENLEDYAAYFDYPQKRGNEEFNIVHQAYRLRNSLCFQESEMTCTTCHDPHKPAENAQTFFNAKCATCHNTNLSHGENCVGCHMPKRRTDDIIHVVMTDHYIQRNPPGNLLQQKAESARVPYKGDLAFYLPVAEKDLYLGLALSRGADLKRAIELLEKQKKSSAEVYFQLAGAYSGVGDKDKAVTNYKLGLALDPSHAEARVNLGIALLSLKRIEDAAEAFRQAIRSKPQLAEAHVALAAAELTLGRLESGRAANLEAIRLDPFNTVALNNLGILEAKQGRSDRSVEYFQRVLRIKPDDAFAKEALGR